ncbi:MAG: efflux RND transporter periplasmic adaptor subunit [Acidobacteriota bacterium]
MSTAFQLRAACIRRSPLLVAVLALTLGVVACGKAPTPPPPAPPPVVTVTAPVQQDVPVKLNYIGTTQAFENVEIRARVQGELKQITFKPSALVKKGKQLFVIEPEPYIASRDRAQASLQSAEAGLRRAESDLDRLEQAVKTNAVSAQEVTRAEAERDQAAAALEEGKAALVTAEIQLGYTTIEAPINGVISRNLVDVGNLVGAGEATLLATVRNIDPIFVFFEVDERMLSRLLAEADGKRPEPGNESDRPIEFILEETGLRVQGAIDFIDNTVDPETGTIMIRAVFPNAKALVLPGVYVRVIIEGGLLEDAIVVEEKAIGTDLSGKYLYVVGADNVVEHRPVELGPRQDDGTIVISSGIELGENYIVDGLLRARPGLPVTPQTAGSGS